MIKLAFWALVAIDVLGVLVLFLLGLAAAGSARTSPLQVALVLLVLPSLPLAAAVLLFVRSSSPGWRALALLLAAAPLGVAVSSRALAQARFRAHSNAAGELTFFRAGPLRDLAEAIGRGDTTAVASLAATVDVNEPGLDGVTPLLLALRQLREAPDREGSIRALLSAGADPNRGAQFELPLAIALQVTAKTGPGPVRMLLEAGADPNLLDSFGTPVYFAATGHSAGAGILGLLLDHGADLGFVGSNGQTALFSAAATRNWKAALLLLERGADWTRGRSVNGLGFRDLVASYAGEPDPDGDLAAVRQRLGLP